MPGVMFSIFVKAEKSARLVGISALTLVTPLGMPLALLHSDLISISAPRPRAYRKAQASAFRLVNGYRWLMQN